MKRLALFALFVALVGCVDETGYDARPDGGEDFVDETGYVDLDDVIYSAGGELGNARPVTIVGLPGAVSPPGGELSVRGQGGVIGNLVGPDDGGAFRTVINAALGDVITFTYVPLDGPEEDTQLTLDDALDAVPAPAVVGTSGPPIVSTVDGNGLVTVMPSGLAAPDVMPPYYLFNLNSSEPGAVLDNDDDVQLAAAVGHSICLFQVREDTQSPLFCAEVPAS